MNVSIGIDIGKKKCDYCVIDGRGKVRDRGQYPNTPSDAREFARAMAAKYPKKGSCRAACETTANMWLVTYEAFESAGIEIKLANTYKMAIIAKTAKKTDKVDAEKIARILRMDMIPECHVPNADVRGVRAMVRQRIKLVQERTRVINRLRNLFDKYEHPLHAKRLYSEKVLFHLEQTRLRNRHDDLVRKQHVRHLRYLTNEINDMDKLLEEEAARNEDVRLLVSMPGVGIYSALLIAAEIDKISRFDSPKRLVSWAGLCPTVHQSGDTLYMGRIKKRDSNRLVKWILCEVANIAVAHDERMKSTYESVRQRHAGKHPLGIIAVANKMITIMWHILTTRTPYESRDEEMYKTKLIRLDRAAKRQ